MKAILAVLCALVLVGCGASSHLAAPATDAVVATRAIAIDTDGTPANIQPEINLSATFDGEPYVGPVNCNFSGPTKFTEDSVPDSFTVVTAGTYQVACANDAPAGATLAAVTPAASLVIKPCRVPPQAPQVCEVNLSLTFVSAAPHALTLPAQTSESTATLYGIVNPYGKAATWWFEYGVHNPDQKTAVQEMLAGTAQSEASATVPFTPHQPFVYRVAIADASGTTPGQVLSVK
jgi:hypothetical protein